MKNYKRSLVSFFLIAIILLSTSWIRPLPAQEEPGPPPRGPPPFEKRQFNGTYIAWEKEENTTSESWEWQSQAWEFGPYPNFAIFLLNGTEVTDKNFIPLGTPFKAVITVQKTIFTGNSTLGRAGLQWHLELRTKNGTPSGQANIKMVYVRRMETKYWNETDSWHIESFVFNQSEVSAMPGQPPPPPEEMGQHSFYIFDKASSKITESEDAWQIEFVGSFDADKTPIGPYWVDLEITDQYDSWVDFGFQAWEGKMAPHRMIAVGKPGVGFGWFMDSWTLKKLDMENRFIYSVSKGVLWKIRINVTSSQLENITIGFDLDWGMKTFVNVTSWYSKPVIQRGGWMFNETSGTYYWNSTVEVSQIEQVFGPHVEERWVWVPHGREINVTRQYWDPETGEEKIVTETFFANEKLFLVYDHSTHSFSVKQGYSYWGYDPELRHDREFIVLYDLNTSDPTTKFYNLSLTESKWYQVAPDRHIIEFVGMFSNETFTDRDEYFFQVNVMGKRGLLWADWTTGPSDFQIAVDKPVAVSTILDKNGNEVKDWMFQINPGEFFLIKSELHGAANLYEDLDGVGVVFHTGSGRWAENESYWSDVEIRLVKDLTTGELSSVTYNRTGRSIYVYGPYRGWELVNVTDWHMEYNSTSGEWEWVEGTYLTWNETIITDWHWEHQRLNQTEYLRDPNSPNIWIDVERTWISDEDSAFKMPSSYAVLNFVNVSLIDGVVTVILNVTFQLDAPHGNYWWNMLFLNMTFDRDWSLGWGEHTVTEWTSEQVYYVNGSVTGGEAWYVTKPTQPMYTVYNGKRYLLEQLPYITIDGVNLPIKVRTQYDWWRQEEWKEYLFKEPYDPILGMEPRYYELLNGTKIYVEESFRALIRTIQLNTTDAYKFVEGDKIPVPNGTVFETYMLRALEDWSKRYWDPEFGFEIVPYYYELLNGTRIYRDEGFETQVFNMTTNRWELLDKLYTENVTPLTAEHVGRGVTLNQTVVLLKEPGDWQPLPDGSGYFLVMKNGTQITIKDPWAVPDDERFVTLNDKKYLISWPDEYYKATYNNQTLLLRGGWDGNVFPFYYTDLGIEGGVKHELPYPGAMASSWWELEGIETEGRKLKTFKSVTINGTKYILHKDESGSVYIIVNGTRVSVSPPMMDRGYYYSQINGKEYWNVVQNGWILRYGKYSDRAGQFDVAGSLVTTTGYDYAGQVWMEHNRWGYDRENSTLYIQTPNGTRYDVHSEIYIILWKVQIGDQQFYTLDAWDQWEEVYDNKTGELLYKSYIRALNGTKIYFNWDVNPPNWLEEIHIQVPGTNYTKLIPFEWGPLQVFDTIYVFNITIPELSWNPGHTGVFYENGTEVPINTTFKVFGTSRGPGTRYWYHWENQTWILDGIFLPMTKAPWNSSLDVQYFTTLDENRIYSPYAFGWIQDEQRWGDPNKEGEFRQWNFINDDPVAGNRTASVVEGGYRVYLNDTIRVDVTTDWPQGGWPDFYLIMTNGTSFVVNWLDDLYSWITEINGKTYLFKHIVTYYNLTDSGRIYNIADPLMPDIYQIFTPTVYQAPLPILDRGTWLWMNATSDSVLRDISGYYLINASDGSRLDIEAVSNWWNLSETARRKLFTDDMRHLYPRYNVTIDGKEYYVIDPSPVIDRWDGEWMIEYSMYRYPKVLNVTLDGTTYSIVLLDDGGFWRSDIRWRRLETIRFGNGTSYEVQEQHMWKPSFQVTINNQTISISLEKMNIYKRHTVWGEVYRWMLKDMNIFTQREVNDIIVGTPEWGMWGIRAFDIVPDTGAVDLDGDLSTTDDQFFVRRIHKGFDAENRTMSRMLVEIIWDPNVSVVDDEMHIFAWMGKLHVSWTSEWSESYIWYYASNMSIVSSTVLQEINATIINSETGLPNPGYWDIAHMVKNVTWADILEQAKKHGWDWITDQKNEWEWIWFGTHQDYVTSWTEENGTQTAAVGVRYEFAGLSLYKDDEQTHFFMPRNIGEIAFVTPGEAFGNTNSSDSMVVPLNATITFGVTYEEINGTLFPFSEQRSMWGWWERPIFGADFHVPNFMHRPTEAAVDTLSFAIHFSANKTEADEANNKAVLKIDQHIGDWNLDPNVIDGRQKNASGVMVNLMGNEVLLNRSLASNFYITAFTSIEWDIKDEKGSKVNNNDVTESSRFDIAAQLANASFATVELGSTYDWGKPVTATDMIRTFNVTSKTTPLGAFRASYQSESGRSSTGFDISAMFYFLTVGFPYWDGYAVYNDPEVLFHLSKGTLIQMEEQFLALPGDQWFLLLAGSAIIAAVVVVAVVFRSKIKRALSRLRRPKEATLQPSDTEAGPEATAAQEPQSSSPPDS
jgi:hypothetical protein